MNQAVDLSPHARQVVAALALGTGLLTNVAIFFSAPALAANRVPPALNPPPPAIQVGNRKAVRAPAPAPARAEEQVLVQASKPIVSTAAQWQKWDDYISIKAGQDQIPLTLSFENGGGLTRFEDLRIRLAGRPLASIRDFRGSQKLALNLTGAVGVGDSLLTIQGYGQPGARLSWKLTTPKPVATAVNPSSFGLNDKVVVQGKNFADKPAGNKVTIGGKAVTVATAKKDRLELRLPNDLPGGKQDLIVTVGSIRCAPLKVTVKVAPEVSSVNFVCTAPGQPVVIYGKGFSTTASENEVTFGGVQATITSATADSISCNVPDLDAPLWYVPIKVKTNGMESKGNVTINIDQRVIPNDGLPQL